MVLANRLLTKYDVRWNLYILTGARLILSAETAAKAATATTNIKHFMIIFYRSLCIFFCTSSSRTCRRTDWTAQWSDTIFAPRALACSKLKPVSYRIRLSYTRHNVGIIPTSAIHVKYKYNIYRPNLCMMRFSCVMAA